MRLVRTLVSLVLLLVSPALLAATAIVLALTDICFLLFGRKKAAAARQCRNDCATVVIPNWNGRDLLEKYLPSVIEALANHPENEILVIDNASTDESVNFVSERFPQVRVIHSETNLGFGGGSNLGFREAKNDIVVLLNSDMRVEPDFLAPLLEPFHDALVFAVACQIFFSDLKKRREETGLTEGWWNAGRIRVSHRIDNEITDAFPCFYAGGGSSAFDRRKFLELGGFEEVLTPFYYEDTDLGLMAWKRGWKVLYQPASIVYHEHRGTIGRKFSPAYVQGILKKNALLFVWKNIHSWKLLGSHLPFVFLSCLRSLLLGDAPQAFNVAGLSRAFLQLPGLCAARWRAKQLAMVSDREALHRPRGLYFRDRFQAAREPVPDRLRILFASPYPIEPPVHGGAVFMKMTLEELAPLADVHLAGMVDVPEQLPAQESLTAICHSVSMCVRNPETPRNIASLLPHAAREFRDSDFAWLLHRVGLLEKIDIIQLEYTQFAQYRGDYRHIPCFLFEHDIHFESVRSLARNTKNPLWRVHYYYEYLRCFRYELKTLPKFRRIQACSVENAVSLTRYVPELGGRIDTDLRAGIQSARFRFVLDGREPDTLLFVGSFRHEPNAEAIRWFVTKVLDRITAIRPQAKLVIVGSDPPPPMGFLTRHPSVHFTGHVEDIREPLERYAVFVCPIRSGSGIRVKLLEAFSSGIPCVSTRLGAEGLAHTSGEICELADSPEEFASAAVHLLSDRVYAASIAVRARKKLEAERDGPVITRQLEQVYRRELFAMRPTGVDNAAAQNELQQGGEVRV
ncbi:MAG TPA: glycosyltransferase [Bryobacteraceae bacterium]|nr:glycosyltransferase [Bryobacteraceae bacterium]